MKPMRWRCAMARVGVAAVCFGAAGAAWPQTFPIVPPKLPPRATTGAAVAAAPPQVAARGAGAQPAAQSSAGPAYGSAQPHGRAQPGAVQSAHGTQPAYGAQQPHGGQQSYGAQQPYGTQPAYGAQPYPAQPYAQQPPAVAAAAPRAPAGPCRVLPSAERQSLALVSGEPPLPREHLPLGEFRALQVVHSPDGRWAVAFTKLRGAPQFAALTLDLERCSVQRTIDLPGAGSDVVFDGDQALLRYAGGERRVPLKDTSVR